MCFDYSFLLLAAGGVSLGVELAQQIFNVADHPQTAAILRSNDRSAPYFVSFKSRLLSVPRVLLGAALGGFGALLDFLQFGIEP